MKNSEYKKINETGVLAKVLMASIYNKNNAEGTAKTKVRFIVEPLDPSIIIPNGSSITVDINQLKTNCGVNPERPNISRLKHEVLEFEFYQMDEDLVNGKKCEKEFTLVKNVLFHESEKSAELSKKMQAIVDVGGVFHV